MVQSNGARYRERAKGAETETRYGESQIGAVNDRQCLLPPGAGQQMNSGCVEIRMSLDNLNSNNKEPK